jgi:hypothetical protein
MRASGYDRTVNDWYIEPAWIVHALLDVEKLNGDSWDPSCGSGNIPSIMKMRGMNCAASDITNRGYGFTADFLSLQCVPTNNIVSNPPYRIIEKYIRRSLELTTNKVCLLARLALLESVKRQSMFRKTPLARVWVSSRRVSMPPGGTNIKAKGGSIAYAWFIWEHGHKGPPTIGWI